MVIINFKRKIGIFLIFFGFFLMLFNFFITGAVIGVRGIFNWLFLLGFFSLIIGGILIGMSKTRELVNETGLVKIITLPRFERMIKNHPREQIIRALEKIGTGKGHEEPLKGGREGQYSIRTTRGGRILFEYNPTRTEAYVFGYTSDHDYKNA